MNAIAVGLFTKNSGDLPEAGNVHGIALAGGSKDVDVTKSGIEHMPHLLTKHFLDEVLLFVPRDFTTDEDCLRITSGHGLS